MKKVTIKDIAKECGVSISTVSNVVNGKTEKVSKDTIELVFDTIKRLNYVPSSYARTLVKKKSKLIAILIPQVEEIKHLILDNPFYSEFIGGVEAAVRENGYNIILSAIDKQKGYDEVILKWNIDGAIVLGIYKEKVYEELKSTNIPIILVDSYIDDENFYRINIDDIKAGNLATKYLIDKGHTNIAIVSGKIKKDGVAERRYLGYRKALEENNIPFKKEYVFEGNVGYEHGIESAKQIIKNNNITAIFSLADIMAAGVISGLNELGKKVPDDYSVIGFDDVLFAKMLIPPLTTVRQDISERGEEAGKFIIELIEKDDIEEGRQMYSKIKIVERSSVKEKT